MINYIVTFMAGCLVVLVLCVVKFRKDLEGLRKNYDYLHGKIVRNHEYLKKLIGGTDWDLINIRSAVNNLNDNVEKIKKQCGMTVEVDFKDLAKGATAVEVKSKGKILGRVER